MTPERWRQVREVLDQALEAAPEQRSALLDQVCSSDHSLRREVEVLLDSSDGVRSSFLQSAGRETLAAGTKLGEYEIVSLIGAGGMGEVYRARDRRLGRDVAIKVLPKSISSDPERLRRFEKEARAAAALNQPNILAVFQMGTHEGMPYLVSELLEGETLRGRIGRGPLTLREAIDYGVQIVRGLAAAHERGIVHRDLKPENLFVTGGGVVKILDFGLAKLAEPPVSEHKAAKATEDTEPGVVMGTVGYMSPEQVRGEVADHRTDIFAFGAILYEMVSGRRAFQKGTAAETMSAILNDDPLNRSKGSAALKGVMRHCLEKNPERRFQSVSDLASSLEVLRNSLVAGAAGRARFRTRLKWAIAITAMIVLAGGFGFWRKWSASRQGVQVHSGIVRRQLTANVPGDPVGSAALSRDGRYLVYNDAATKKLHLLEVDSGEVRDLQFKDTPEIVQDWFPDGSRLLVTERSGLCVVSIWDGICRRPLGQIAVGAKVSPDGSHIAFANRHSEGIWLMGSDGEDPHRLPTLKGDRYSQTSLAWSPRGRRLVYIREWFESDGKRNAAIESSGLDGSHRIVVLFNPDLLGPMGYPALCWLADGRILYSLRSGPTRGSAQDIWTVAVDPETGKILGQPAVLTNREQSLPYFLYANAEGRRLILSSGRSNDAVYLAELGSGGKRPNSRRLTLDDWVSLPSDWTRDSKAVLYTSDQVGKYVILKQEIGRRAPEILVSGVQSYSWPVLSPGGDRLFYNERPPSSPWDSDSRLVSVVSGAGTRSVLLPGDYSIHCAFSPSGGCVVAQFKGRQIVFSVLDPITGKGAEIQHGDTALPNTAPANWSLSPDGTKIAFVDSLHWVRILTIATHKVAPLPHIGEWDWVETVAWAADGNHLFATAWLGNPQTSQAILFIDTRSMTVKVVDEIPKNTGWLNVMAASPDGRYLAYGKRIYEANVVMLEKF